MTKWAVLPLILLPLTARANDWIGLFNGKNLDGWVVKCRPEDNDKRG